MSFTLLACAKDKVASLQQFCNEYLHFQALSFVDVTTVPICATSHIHLDDDFDIHTAELLSANSILSSHNAYTY